jgi:D-3-phosphoglycerate dehydrogenase
MRNEPSANHAIASSSHPCRVMITDYAWPDVELERRMLAAENVELVVAPEGSELTLAAMAQRYDVAAIMACWAKVTPAVIDASPRCRHVARLGIGLDNIDVRHCSQRGIPVTNVPDYCRTEVAEHTLASILALGRNIGWYHHATKIGSYAIGAGPPLRRLAGRTVGIVGYGGIGREVAARARAFGFQVLATTRTPRVADKLASDAAAGGAFAAATAGAASVKFVTLDELVRASDFVTLHLPLTDTTRHIVNRELFERFQPGAFLINTARGGLVDHEALTEALADGRLAGAALDVQTPEPPDLSRAPYNDPRVIVTPHAAFLSAESLLSLRTQTVEQVLERLRGKMPANVVNAAEISNLHAREVLQH